jgi:nucleotide-binding universal stress UspA family protein
MQGMGKVAQQTVSAAQRLSLTDCQANKMNTELAEIQLTEREASPKSFSVRKIVVALDLSPHSEATAQYALGIAKTLGASLVLIHVYEPVQMNEFITEEGFRVLDHEEQVVRQALTNLTKTLQKTYPACREKFIVGEPAEEVALAARELDADLIITASHHLSFPGRLFGLDQAPKITHRAPCPVLVYHDKEEG